MDNFLDVNKIGIQIREFRFQPPPSFYDKIPKCFCFLRHPLANQLTKNYLKIDKVFHILSTTLQWLVSV